MEPFIASRSHIFSVTLLFCFSEALLRIGASINRSKPKAAKERSRKTTMNFLNLCLNDPTTSSRPTVEMQSDGDFFDTLRAAVVNVEMLKVELSRGQSRGEIGAYPFQSLLEKELVRVASFVQSQQDRLEFQSKDLLRQADNVPRFVRRGASGTEATIQNLRVLSRSSTDNYIALQEFLTTNRQILLNLAEAADRDLPTSCLSSVSKHLPKVTLDSGLVCVHSDLYNAIRNAEESLRSNTPGEGDALWQAPSSFQRSTTKYWIKDENLTELMLTCTEEAPLLVYGKKGPLTSTNALLPRSEGDKLWETLATRITSVYFDSADMSLYKDRIQRLEGAQLLRARWYGTKKPVGTEIIFLELKTHHEKWVANKSVKERASIQEQDMMKFMEPVAWVTTDAENMIKRAKPKLKCEEVEKATELLMRMHRLVVKHNLTSCVRSVYSRAAFQSSTNNGKVTKSTTNIISVTSQLMTSILFSLQIFD